MSSRKLNVILDLDNTIINSLTFQETARVSSEFQASFDHFDMQPYYRVFARPGLQQFLDYLFANFNVSVWTAADADYALSIINQFILIKPERKLDVIFYRYHVTLGLNRYGGMKDLRLLWELFKLKDFYPYNTVIIDDLSDVQEANPYNTIHIPRFEMMTSNRANSNAPFDDVLAKVAALLKTIRVRDAREPRQMFIPVLPHKIEIE